MDPYKSPKQTASKPSFETSGDKKYGPCPDCGSMNGSKSNLSQRNPSIIFFLLVGWIYLLFKLITRRTTVRCEDCDEYYNI